MIQHWKTPLLAAAAILTVSFTWMTFAQQYDPRALQRGGQPAPANQPAAGEEFDEFATQWPIDVQSPQGRITIYQPQMENLEGNLLSARAAVSIAQGTGEPVFGVVWFQSRIATDRASRVVQVMDVNITQVRLPDADPSAENALGNGVRQAMTQQPLELSLDQLLAMLESANLEGQDPAEFSNDAPRILFIEHPAIKVQYDGEPKLIPMENSAFQRVANTPFFVVLDPGSRTYFLKGGGVWYEAGDPLGPFRRSSRVPQEAIRHADEFGYKDPQEPLPADQLNRLEIITATDPTELVWTDGPPQMATVPGTGLLYVTNTDSDVFMTVESQRVYVLTSGRWYEAPSRRGPWAFVAPDRLPADFSRIPANSPSGDVLAHIAGTPQALEAVADTYVPQTAAVSRSQYEQPVIDYDGDPRFEPVEGVGSVSYAVNSPQSVVAVDRRYYACYNAVWYVSDSPRGRWDLCTDVPQVIYTIPPSCPIYPVRYVYVYDHTPEYVYCGYTPGYVGSYVYHGTVVYGTGYRYRPWQGRHYYSRPYTYGFGARYNSYANQWGFSFGYRTGGGALWVGYREGTWARRDPWFGYGGYRPVLVRNDVRRDYFRHQYRGRDWDRGRPDRNVTVINQQNTYIENVNIYQRRNDVRRMEVRNRVADAPRQPQRRVEERNNVLADREGRVYRRTNDGDWEVRENRQWRREDRAPAVQEERRAPAARGDQPARGQLTAAARPVDPDAPVVRRRPADPVRGADRPAARGDENARGRGDDNARGRGSAARDGRGDQPDARPAADRTPTAPPRETPQTLERRDTPPTPPPAANRGDRGRGQPDDRDEQNARGQGAGGDRGTARAPVPTPAPTERRDTAPPTPAERRDAPPPAQVDENRANRGRAPADPDDRDNRGDRGTARAPAREPAREPAPAARGNQPDRDDRADPGDRGRGRSNDRAQAPPSQREMRDVERDFRARQNAENRLPNYQRQDRASDAPSREGRPEPRPEARPEPRSEPRPEPPARGRDNDAPRGRGADREDNRGRGNDQDRS